MNVLVACEESQRVCMEFRKRGHNAFSCDLKPPSGGFPEYHIQGDALYVANSRKWDLIIAHPPCTFLSSVANRSHSAKCAPVEMINRRTMERIDAMRFFMEFVLLDCGRICIENPLGVMNTAYRKPDQIIDPWQYSNGPGDSEYVTKRTCLWLKGLEQLVPTFRGEKPNNEKIYGRNPNGKVSNWKEHIKVNRAEIRSKTFIGIARAMAEQWG